MDRAILTREGYTDYLRVQAVIAGDMAATAVRQQTEAANAASNADRYYEAFLRNVQQHEEQGWQLRRVVKARHVYSPGGQPPIEWVVVQDDVPDVGEIYQVFQRRVLTCTAYTVEGVTVNLYGWGHKAINAWITAFREEDKRKEAVMREDMQHDARVDFPRTYGGVHAVR